MAKKDDQKEKQREAYQLKKQKLEHYDQLHEQCHYYKSEHETVKFQLEDANSKLEDVIQIAQGMLLDAGGDELANKFTERLRDRDLDRPRCFAFKLSI